MIDGDGKIALPLYCALPATPTNLQPRRIIFYLIYIMTALFTKIVASPSRLCFPLSEHKPINVGFSCLPALLDENENLARGVLLLDLTEVEVVGVQVRRLEQR